MTVWGQAGLFALSEVFALAAFLVTRVMAMLRPLVIRVPVWTVLFITFVWASPQGYYAYYRLFIDGLPAQSVIGPLPPPDVIPDLLTFQSPTILPAHSLGSLGWLMFVVALLSRPTKCRDAAN